MDDKHKVLDYMGMDLRKGQMFCKKCGCKFINIDTNGSETSQVCRDCEGN